MTALDGVERRIAPLGTQAPRPDPGLEGLPVMQFFDEVKAGL